MTDLRIPIGGVTLQNPVLTASGTFGYGLEYDGFYDIAQLGGICTKGLSLAPRLGNAPERICETPAGMLNAIGLANVGVEAFCREKLPQLRQRGVAVIANIFASSIDDFVRITERLSEEAGIFAIELNVSCPNVKEGGIEFGKDAKMCAEVTLAVRKRTQIPIWVKMSPEAGDINAVGKACEEAGADALTAINTIRGMVIDTERQKPRLANTTGGFSGPGLRPIALRIVWQLYRAVKIPIIGIGGVATARDAVEFMLAGASAVQVGTANFYDPFAAKKVLEGLSRYLENRGIDAKALIGRAHE